MKKVLIVTTIQNTIKAFLIPHIKRLMEQEYRVEVATNITDLQYLQEEINQAEFHHIPFSRKIYDISNVVAFGKIRKLLVENKYDAIHAHTPIASFLTRFAAPRDCKVLYTAHGFHVNENAGFLSNRLFFIAEKLAGLKTDGLIVINQEDRLTAAKLVPEEKIFFVKGVGVDTEKYSPSRFSDEDKVLFKRALNLPPEKKVITQIAEFNENKRQIDLVKACERIKEKYQDFVVLLIGSGPNFPLVRNEVAKRNLDSHIRLLGYRSDIDRLLSITDIGVLVSLREGLPRSVMEMMAMKIPVVLTDIRGNRDLVRHGVNGYLVPIKNPAQLADYCMKLLLEDEIRQSFGDRSREIIEDEYALEKILTKMDTVYQKLVLSSVGCGDSC
ncbi:glycosyltransferase family 4 protein [Effusibacillus lacus]|uniref:Glycosyltransferase family 1 protein n=1 Tax=Effusibacillus lacus TaxID=1348429 RepID=A0A292YJQ3_9BACL|nr:glycosyltransferase family 4 protein [Effusibacillus lacus]TCS70817.1 glycosyltransferase involved in cell wall biosynthesis [Effusibacillus lacus]GAX89386.1 glycosyltransferase family 1 protein [Effusibacillus lacus]